MRPLLAIFATLFLATSLSVHGQSDTSTALIAKIEPHASGHGSTSPSPNPMRWYFIGESSQLRVVLERCGHCSVTEHAHALVQLPPGITFTGFTGYNYLHGTCTAEPVNSAGQRVICTGVRGLALGLSAIGSWDIHVQASNTLTAPTSLRFVLAHDDHPTPDTSRLDACIASTMPAYCDEMAAIARHRPDWDLRIDHVEAQPAGYFYPGDTNKRVFARISSHGEIGTHFFLDLRLPPGYLLNPGTSGGNPIGASCAVIGGDITIGTIVRCTGVTPLLTPNFTLVGVGVDVHPQHVTREGEIIVFATGSTEPAPDPDRLIECAADPDLPYCAWLQVSASACPELPGLEQPIWCNGFEGNAD